MAFIIGALLKRVMDSLDAKAERKDLEKLENDFRTRQAASDDRWSQLMQDHGRLMGMLEDYRRRNGWPGSGNEHR